LFVSPAFDENNQLIRLDFYVSGMAGYEHIPHRGVVKTGFGGSFYFEGGDARNIASVLNKRFDLSIGKSPGLGSVQEVKSTLDGDK